MSQDQLQDLLDRLSQQAGVLPLQGQDVELLDTPDQFFQALLEGLRTAQHHISIASLYFGTGGGREQQFAEALAAAAHDPARPHLRMHILLDALRSTRPSRAAPSSTADNHVKGGASSSSSSSGGSASSSPGMTSTAEMLAVGLLEGQQQAQCTANDNNGSGCTDGMPSSSSSSSSRVAVSLFHTPALRGLLKRVLPPRVSEVIGVCHMKAYCFDDTVIISGANISSTYLSTRQDRYVLIRNTPHLATFMRQLVDTVGRFSYQLQAAGTQPAGGDASGSGSGRRRDVLLRLLQQQRLPWQQPGGTTGTPDEPAAGSLQQQPGRLRLGRLHPAQQQAAQQRYSLAPCPAGVDPVRQAGHFCRLLRQALLHLFVPQQAWHSVLDFTALEHEAAADALWAESVDVGPHWHPAPAGHSMVGAASGSGSSIGSGSWGTLAGAASPAEDASSTGGLPQQQPAAAPVAAAAGSGADTWIVPMVQAGFAGVRQEERCMLDLLSWALQQQQAAAGSSNSSSDGVGSREDSGRVLLQLASPYLNLARPYEWLLSRQAASAADLELVTSSPEANGFFGSRGVSGYIPLAYSLLEHRTWRRLTRQQRRRAAAAAIWGQQQQGQGQVGQLVEELPLQPTAEGQQEQQQHQRVWRDSLGYWGGSSRRWGSWYGQQQADMAGAKAAVAAAEVVEPAATAAGTQHLASPFWWQRRPQQQGSRQLLEYSRPGWEFHAKGLWVTLPRSPPPADATGQQCTSSSGGSSTQQQPALPTLPGTAPADAAAWGPARTPAVGAGAAAAAAAAGPAVTAVGSSNFGFRSLHRDLEVQFLLVTRNPQLQQALAREVAQLKQHCQAVSDAHFQAPGRRGGAVARMAVRLLRGFL